MSRCEYLTPEELVLRYGKDRLSLRTLRRWRQQERGPKTTWLEGRLLYHIRDIEAWERKSPWAIKPRLNGDLADVPNRGKETP